MKTCFDCKYYGMETDGKDSDGKPVKAGHCFRYPPQIGSNGGSAVPMVRRNLPICGEAKAKPRARK